MRIGIFGPHLGGNAGWVTSQGEVLESLLGGAGLDVVSASTHPGRVQRAADTVAAVLRHGRSLDAAIVAVFSGPGFAMAELAGAALRLHRIPTVLVLHGGNLPSFARRHPGRVRRLLGGAAKIVAPSPFLARELSAYGARVEVLPNSLPLEKYPSSVRVPPRPRLLWMRTMAPLYRPELALEVAARLRDGGRDVHLTLAGQDRGMLKSLRRLAAEERVTDLVSFPGFLGPTDKWDAFGSHDIFLSTNAVDNTPVSAIEAAASGLVNVAMDVGGMSDLFTHGENALLVPDGDVDAMADAVESVLTDDTLARRLSEGGHQLGSRSTQEAVLTAWLELLDEVATGR